MSGSQVVSPAVVGDVVAGGAIVSALLGFLPVVAAVIAVVWYLIQIWESRTVQDWLVRRAGRRKTAKIARLRAKHKILVAELDALEMVRAAKTVAAEKVETAKAAAAVDQVTASTTAAVNDITSTPPK